MKKLTTLTAMLLLSACASKSPAPVDDEAIEPGYAAESPSAKAKPAKKASEASEPAKQAATTSRSDASGLSEAIESGNDDSIAKAASIVLAKNSNDAKALNAMGLVQYHKGHLPAALLMFDKALKADPRLAAAHSNRGLVYLSQKEDSSALKEFRKALEVDPVNGIAAANIGSIYIENKDYTKALVAMEIAYRQNSKDVKVLNNYGIALTANEKYPQAKDVYKKAMDLNPGNKDIMLNYAILLIEHLNASKDGLDLLSKIRFLGPSPEVRNRINVLENSAKAGLK